MKATDVAKVMADTMLQVYKRTEGEMEAYRYFCMSGNDTKPIDFIDAELMVVESELEESETIDDWEYAMGRKHGLINLKKQVVRHGE